MLDKVKRTGLVVAMAMICVFVLATVAGATSPDPSTVVGDAAGDLKDEVLAIAAIVLPYAAILVALTLGWRFARKFVRG